MNSLVQTRISSRLIFTMEKGKREWETVVEYIFIRMEIYMKANGRNRRNMATVHTCTLMVKGKNKYIVYSTNIAEWIICLYFYNYTYYMSIEIYVQ